MQSLLIFLSLVCVSLSIEAVRLSPIPNGMCVGWSTTLSYASPPKLSWGYTPALGAVTDGITTDYGTRFFHYVRLTNLTASTKVYYQIESDPVATFITAPEIGALSSYPFTMLQIGDLGVGFGADKTVELMKQRISNAAFTLHSGSILDFEIAFIDLFQVMSVTLTHILRLFRPLRASGIGFKRRLNRLLQQSRISFCLVIMTRAVRLISWTRLAHVRVIAHDSLRSGHVSECLRLNLVCSIITLRMRPSICGTQCSGADYI